MKRKPKDTPTSFKDYCLILQVHPEADSGMVEAAYWHLAKRYSAAGDSDPTAKAHLDDLNEAYSVLGSPKHREEYMAVRAEVLGDGALPAPPPPPPEPVPLAVMAKRRPRAVDEQEQLAPQGRSLLGRLGLLTWQSSLAVLIMGALAAAAVTAGVHLAVVAILLAIGIAITAMPSLAGMLVAPRGKRQRTRLASIKVPSKPDARPKPIATRVPEPADERKVA